MNKQDQHKSLWNDRREAQKEEQRFHIHYSAAGLGLLMTLQTFRQPGADAEAAGPGWLWITALAMFASCLLLSGWSYWWDARYQYAFLLDYAQGGSFKAHPRWEKFLRLVDVLVRASFFAGVVSSAAYFICQRF